MEEDLLGNLSAINEEEELEDIFSDEENVDDELLEAEMEKIMSDDSEEKKTEEISKQTPSFKSDTQNTEKSDEDEDNLEDCSEKKTEKKGGRRKHTNWMMEMSLPEQNSKTTQL